MLKTKTLKTVACTCLKRFGKKLAGIAVNVLQKTLDNF